jgi:regulator of sigma E protease
MDIFGYIQTGVVFFLVLSVLVLIHELGHYLVARIIGVKVEEFGFGLPPKLFGKKFKWAENEWSINWLPIGGFVRLAGEDELGESIEESKKKYTGKQIQKFFWARTKLERAAILVAGVTMNFLLAVGITSYLITRGLTEPAPRVKIEDVLPNTPAQAAGLKIGDSVSSIEYRRADGTTEYIQTRIPEELVKATRAHLGEEITLVLLRDGNQMRLNVTPRKEFPEGEGPMGIKIGFDVRTIKYPWYQAPFYALTLNLQRARDMVIGLATLPAKALSGQKVRDEVAGPIGIAQVTGQAARIGTDAVLNLTSILSLSLALLNILPIPALDGGRLLFILIEAVLRKPVHPSWERNAHQIGMLMLLLFIALVTLNDISRIARG